MHFEFKLLGVFYIRQFSSKKAKRRASREEMFHPFRS